MLNISRRTSPLMHAAIICVGIFSYYTCDGHMHTCFNASYLLQSRAFNVIYADNMPTSRWKNAYQKFHMK
uniref:Secreted protein n=1 Tax=Ascaris lumbricoides TaxID=6252 RepID=A0A0M3HFD4_ASCLU